MKRPSLRTLLVVAVVVIGVLWRLTLPKAIPVVAKEANRGKPYAQ